MFINIKHIALPFLFVMSLDAKSATRFDVAQSKFQAAHTLAISSVRSELQIKAGNCVNTDKPDVLYPGLLCAVSSSDPLFGGFVSAYKSSTRFYQNSDPSYFISSPTSVDDCDLYVASFRLETQEDGELAVRDVGTYSTTAMKLRNAEDDEYWITEAYSLSNNGFGDEEQTEYCWYWVDKTLP